MYTQKTFVNYAHRGASSYAPENTFLAFYTGVFMGANGIETDVQKTADGVLVLFHDDTLERVTGEQGSVSDYTYKELQRFLVKKDGLCDKIVRFEDFLKAFSFRELTFAIELKQPYLEEEVAALVRAYNMEEKAEITSFDFESLVRMHACAPGFTLGYLTKTVTGELLGRMEQNGIWQLCPEAQLVTRDKVVAWHERGFSVRAWGVYDTELMKMAYDAGADGMTVNFPDELSSYIKRKKQS